MPSPDLQHLFESLVMPITTTAGNSLSAVPIPGSPAHRLAKDASGSPCLLVQQAPSHSCAAPIRLENLRVSFSVLCTVTDPGGKQEQNTFTIVRCAAANGALFPHFLKIISPIVTALGPSPTPAAIGRAISGLVVLFQAISAPAKKTVQGIWAELLLIRLSSDPRAMATAWHRDPVEHFDFAAGPQRIEVKSSMNRKREHFFSLEQLTSPGHSRIVVASVFVERVGGGVSLQKLFDDTRALLQADPQLLSRYDAVFYSSLGSGWADAMDEAFDWELATESIAYYPAELIPRPENPTPHSVFDVRFRSDLGAVRSFASHEIQRLGGLMTSAVPAVWLKA
jgi:hypothetical protein